MKPTTNRAVAGNSTHESRPNPRFDTYCKAVAPAGATRAAAVPIANAEIERLTSSLPAISWRAWRNGAHLSHTNRATNRPPRIEAVTSIPRVTKMSGTGYHLTDVMT